MTLPASGSLKSVCVFCGSRSGNDPAFTRAAIELGRTLAERKIRLVFGGGQIGIMGSLADAVLAHHGEVTGVIPEALTAREIVHQNVADMRVVDSMHTRKALMAKLSDGFIALPGGLGTFEELCEVLTWRQLRIHHKPVALLNVNGYYSPLLNMLRTACENGFMGPENLGFLHVTDSIPALLGYLETYGHSEPESDAKVQALT